MEVTKTSLSVAAVEAATRLYAGTGDVEALKNAIKGIEGHLHSVYDADAVAQKRAATVSSGGGYRRGGGSGTSNANPATLKFKGTKFDGKTVEEVYKMSASEAFANHQYKDQDGNPQEGRKFVEWLATKDGFMAGKCKAYLDGLNAPQTTTEATPAQAEAPAAAPADEFSFGGGSW